MNEAITAVGPEGGANAQTRPRGAASCKDGETRRQVYPGGTGAGAVPPVQARMGRHRGKDAERAGHSLCVPVLSGIAPRARPRARVPEIAARPVGQVPPGGRVKGAEE